MMNQSVKLAIKQTEPTTKAAQLRLLMPDIEVKLAEGVQLGAMHKALVAAGFDLTFQTFKTYLYRYRRKVKTARPTEIIAPHTDGRSTSAPVLGSGEVDGPWPDSLEFREPVSTVEIHRLMKPDPAQQAQKIARYERLAKQQRRSSE